MAPISVTTPTLMTLKFLFKKFKSNNNNLKLCYHPITLKGSYVLGKIAKVFYKSAIWKMVEQIKHCFKTLLLSILACEGNHSFNDACWWWCSIDPWKTLELWTNRKKQMGRDSYPTTSRTCQHKLTRVGKVVMYPTYPQL